MNITTSNYTKRGGYANSYAISIKAPSYYHGKHFPLLAPTWDMVMGVKNGKLNEHQYAEMYFNHTQRKITAERVLDLLPDNACLLCYEPGFTFCHRRLVAMWIETETGIKVPEWVEPSVTNRYNFINNTMEF